MTNLITSTATINSLSYKELQAQIKIAKSLGLTDVKANAKKDVLLSTLLSIAEQSTKSTETTEVKTVTANHSYSAHRPSLNLSSKLPVAIKRTVARKARKQPLISIIKALYSM